MSKKLMILGGSVLQLPAIKTALKLKLETIVVDKDPDAVGFDVEGVEKVNISTTDIMEVTQVAKKCGIDGIMTLATDMPMRTVASIASELGLVGIDKETAFRSTNKAAMRQAFQQCNVPIPKFYKASSLEDYLSMLKKLTPPVILKPVDSSGSRGIFKIDDFTDIAFLEEAYKYCRMFSKARDIMIEEFMSGPEVSVETLSIDGVCHVIQITDKVTTGAPHFVEIGHSQPSLLPKHVQKQIIEIAQLANKAVGIQNGPSHVEIIVTADGPKVVEIGARLGGDNITTHLVPLSTGVDMVECCIKMALGEQIDISSKWTKASAIRYFRQERGRIKSIEGIEEARQFPGVEQLELSYGKGDLITEIESSGSRLGYVIACADNVNESIKVCEDAINLVSVYME